MDNGQFRGTGALQVVLLGSLSSVLRSDHSLVSSGTKVQPLPTPLPPGPPCAGVDYQETRSRATTSESLNKKIGRRLSNDQDRSPPIPLLFDLGRSADILHHRLLPIMLAQIKFQGAPEQFQKHFEASFGDRWIVAPFA